MPDTKRLSGVLSAGECVGLALFGAYAAMLWLHAGMASLTDYSNWTYQGVLLRDHLLGRPDAAHWFKPYPVPNSAATLGVGLLALVLPWMAAAKAWLCVQMALEFFALRHMLRTLNATAWAWVALPGALFLNVNFWYGFTNFELGLCWVLWLGSVLLRAARGEGLREWKVGLLLVAAFFTHMIPFAFCGLLLALYVWQTKQWKLLRQLAPSAVLCAWYVVGRFAIAHNADGQAGMAASVRDYSAMFWLFKLNSYLKSFGFVNPNGADAVVFGKAFLLVLLVANLVLAVALGWRMLVEARRGLSGGAPEKFLWWACAVVLPLFLLAPGAALGVSDPGARMLQTALALALALGMRRVGRAVYLSAACAALLTMAGGYLFAHCAFGVCGGPALTAEPAAMRDFADVPNHDQDEYLDALGRGDDSLPVFPTSMVLNGKTPAESKPFMLPRKN